MPKSSVTSVSASLTQRAVNSLDVGHQVSHLQLTQMLKDTTLKAPGPSAQDFARFPQPVARDVNVPHPTAMPIYDPIHQSIAALRQPAGDNDKLHF